MLNGELMLWRKVVIQAMKDTTRKQNPIERRKAINWFLNESKDFLLVCEFAQLAPERVIDFVCKTLLRKK